MKKHFNLLPMLVLLLICLSSCRTIRETQTEYLTIHDTDTIREVRTQRDSIYIYEKEREYMRGDTVYLDRWHYEYRDKAAADTVRMVKTVTITNKLYYTKEKEVYRLRWWQTALCWSGGALWLAVFALCGYKLIKRKFKF